MFASRYYSSALLLAILLLPLTVHGQVTFYTPPTYAGYGNLFTADFNGDGKPDLLTSDGTMNLGKGDGTFTTGTPVTGTPLAVADFNGDGKPDVFEQGSATLVVLLGNGNGTFQSPITTDIGITLGPVGVADLSGDQESDVIGVAGTTLYVYPGNGNGMFGEPTSYNLGTNVIASSIVFGDFNGDGKTDVAVITSGDNAPGNILVFLGNGNGTLQQVPKVSAGVLNPGQAVTGDFNEDGNLDLAIGGGYILLGKGDGTFQAPTIEFGWGLLATADLRGNGKLDLITYSAGLVQVYLGNGDGTFAAGNTYFTNLDDIYTGIAVADFNLDGKLDVAVESTILLGNGDGTFQGYETLLLNASVAVAGDFRKNGIQDLAVISGSNLDILTNDGAGKLTVAHTYPVQTTYAMVTADFNGDGNLDLLLTGQG